MAKDRIGRLPPRYSLLLNPYRYERLSKCPLCKRPTHARKFALVVGVEKFGVLALGKMCHYCTPCELIIVHQHELEAELANSMEKVDPDLIGNDYFVIGTMDKKAWKSGLGKGMQPSNLREYAAMFKKRLNLIVEPSGWQPE